MILDLKLVDIVACWGVVTPPGDAQAAKITYQLDAADVCESFNLLDISCGGLSFAASTRGISYATGRAPNEDEYDFVKELAFFDVDIHRTWHENFSARRPDDAAISTGAADRLRIYEKSFQQVARWFKPGRRLSLQTCYLANIGRAYTDAIVSIDIFHEPDLPLRSEIHPASRSHRRR